MRYHDCIRKFGCNTEDVERCLNFLNGYEISDLESPPQSAVEKATPTTNESLDIPANSKETRRRINSDLDSILDNNSELV